MYYTLYFFTFTLDNGVTWCRNVVHSFKYFKNLLALNFLIGLSDLADVDTYAYSYAYSLSE